MIDFCFICGRKREIEEHHLISRQTTYPYNRVVNLCGECHLALHKWKSRGNISETIKMGLQRAKLNGKKLGRQFGSKDKKPRSRIGYWKRWSKKEEPLKWIEKNG